jgi:hypothetical protein
MASLEEQIEATKHSLEALEVEKKKRDTENEKIKNENQRYTNMQNHLQQILTTVREMKGEFLDMKRRIERLEEQNHFKNLNELPPFDFFSNKDPKNFLETIGSILNVKHKVEPVNEVNVPYKDVSDTSSESDSDISNISLEIEAFDKSVSNSSPVAAGSSILTQKLINRGRVLNSLTPPVKDDDLSSDSLTPPPLNYLSLKEDELSSDSLTPPPLNYLSLKEDELSSDSLTENNVRDHNTINPFNKEMKKMHPLPVEFTENLSNNNITRPISSNSSSSLNSDEKKNEGSFFGWNY